MSFYFIVFLIVIFFSLLASFSTKKINNKYVVCDELYYISVFALVFILFFISAFRYNVGTDYVAYESYAEEFIYPFSIIKAIEQSELFFVIFSKLSYKLFGNLQLLYVIIAFFFMFFMIKGILFYEKKIFLPILFLFITTTFFISLNAMRQMVSFAIFLYASRYIAQKNFKKYFFNILIAFFWHSSSIIYIIIYFFGSIKIRKSLLFIVFLSFITKYFINKIIMQFLSNTGIPLGYYFRLQENASSKSFLLISFFICVTFILFALEKNNIINNLLFNISIIGFLISIFVDGIPGGYRLVYVYWPIYVVICPYIYRRSKSYKYLLLLFYLLIFSWYFYRQHIMGNSGEVVPYNFIF